MTAIGPSFNSALWMDLLGACPSGLSPRCIWHRRRVDMIFPDLPWIEPPALSLLAPFFFFGFELPKPGFKK